MLGGTLARLETQAIRDALREHGTLKAAAGALGLSRDALKTRMRRLGLRLRPPRAPRRPDPPIENLNTGPECLAFHDWRLVRRTRTHRGVRRIWHCQRCPAVRTLGPT